MQQYTKDRIDRVLAEVIDGVPVAATCDPEARRAVERSMRELHLTRKDLVDTPRPLWQRVGLWVLCGVALVPLSVVGLGLALVMLVVLLGFFGVVCLLARPMAVAVLALAAAIFWRWVP